MAEQDLPMLDESVSKLPQDIRADLAERGRRDLFFFNKAILGYRDMTFDCHGPLCAYVDLNKSKYKLILQPRDHLKTSAITIGGTMQKVVRNSEERILIANESATNAERFLRSIRQHAEGNRVFRSLYSESIHKDTRKVRWNDSELDFVRQGFYPEPTIDSIGMTGAVTSRHYTHITYDDPISEEAVKSEKVMKDTIDRMSAALSLLVNPENDSIWLVGTRWALHDVYSFWIKTFGPLLTRFVRGAIEDGLPIWPERFSLETLALKRAALGEYKFSCLMMNNPRNSDVQDLNIEDFRFWEWNAQRTHVILYNHQMEIVRVHALDELDITTTVDPASSENLKNDRNAIVTVGVTPFNEAIVLDVWAERCDALKVIEKLFEIKQRFHPRVFGIEDVGYQKVLKVFVKQEADRRHEYLNIKPLPAKGQKKVRIRGLQPYAATGRLYINAQQHLLRNEASEFPLGEHDDTIDALSMHIMLFRGQMSPEVRSKYQKSEAQLFHRIEMERLQGAQRPVERLDLDEFPDEFDRPQIPIRDFILQ